MSIPFNRELWGSNFAWIWIIIMAIDILCLCDVTLAQQNSYRVVTHNPTQNPGELCNRECVRGDKRVCYFDFTIEHYQAMGVDFPVLNGEVFQRGRYNHFINLGSNTTVVGSINGLSLIFPYYPPLTQPELIDETEFCDENTRPARCDNMAICHCIHRLKVRLNSVVELIIVDETEPPEGSIISHPFHLHGYRFIVTGMGRDPSGRPMNVPRAKIMDARNQLPRFSSRGNPPLKDTVSIPSRGFAAVRFRATNPGLWLMHCHYDWHFGNGMGLFLQVGEISQMIKPPRNFPKCGNCVPPVK